MTFSAAFGVTDLLVAPTDTDRLAHLHDVGLADEDGLGWVLDRVEELVHDEPGAADELARLCDASAGVMALDAVAARARYLRARVHAERGDLERALELIAQARAGWWRIGRHVSALRTDLGRMQILDDMGLHHEAASLGEALIDALDRLPDDSTEDELRNQIRAVAIENVGVAYSFTGDHARALDAYAHAEATYRALGMHEETARPLGNRGIELLALGRAREAVDVLRAAAAAFAAAGDRLFAAKCQGNVAQAHSQLGELVEALRVLEPARTVLDGLGAEAEAARLRLAIAEIYLAVGLFAEASSEASDAARRLTAAGMPHDTATAHFTMGLAQIGAGNLDESAAELRVAIGLFEQVGDRQHQARARLAQAEVAAARGDRSEAAALAASTAESLHAGGWLAPLAWARLRQADLATDDAAVATHLDQAAELCAELRLPQLRHAYELRTARLRRRQGRTEDAESLLRRVIDGVEQLGDSLPDHALRTAFRADKGAAHDELVDLLLVRGHRRDLAAACLIGDQSKAQTLSDLLAGTIGARVPPGRVDTRSELGARTVDLNAIYGELLTADQPGRRASLRRRADELEKQISTLRLRLAVADPSGPGASCAPPALPASEPAHPALAYHVLGDDVVAFTVQAGEVSAQRLVGVMPAVESELDRLAAQWSRFRMGTAFTRRHQAALLRTAQEILHALHQLLIAPVRGLADVGDRVVIVPHRRLCQVPFHALYDGSHHLTERWAITVAPSLGTGRATTGPADFGRGALVLAVPDAHTPSAGTEARILSDIVPDVRTLIGAAATSDALARALPGPGIVHIACHGLYRAGNPLFSALRLSDRWVTSADILDLDFGGALVTLSACETGRHHTDTAEPVGLAWALLAAGAAGAVVSQWVVHDDVTATLMSDFYRRLTAGDDPANALRRAQLGTAAEHPHPFYWAPFTYVASPETTLTGVGHDPT